MCEEIFILQAYSIHTTIVLRYPIWFWRSTLLQISNWQLWTWNTKLIAAISIQQLSFETCEKKIQS